MSERIVEWRVYCPRCQHPHEPLIHKGLASHAHELRCEFCHKTYDVVTAIDDAGAPICHATPYFVKTPVVLSDSDPRDIPR